MKNELCPEYKLLFNAMSDAISDVQFMLSALSVSVYSAKDLLSNGTVTDREACAALLLRQALSMTARLQTLQLSMIKAQQRAEALYLERTN